MKVIITGAAGFIGFHTAKHLLENGFEVIGLDNFDPYYDVKYKQERVDRLPGMEFHAIDITDTQALRQVLDLHSDFSAIVHLAAQAGVEHSFNDPKKYIDVNITGFQNILDGMREVNPDAHLVYASSSSIYGDVDHPKSLYGVTKIANEMTAFIYADTFGLPSTGLRFFTVYGPWGRPDMAIYKFVDAIMEDRPVELFNMGNNERDFTYIDDVVDAIELALLRDTDSDPFAIYDIGTEYPIQLHKVIAIIEKTLGRKAKKWLDVAKKGDIISTCASIEKAEDELGYKPKVRFEEGIKRFVQWYQWYKNEHLVEEDSKQH